MGRRFFATMAMLAATTGCTQINYFGEQVVAREVIATDAAPAAIGPYSQAIRIGNTIYVSGQIPFDPATGALVTGGIEDETRQVMENIKAILAAGGFEMGHVVQVKVFLSDLDDYGAMNEVYASYFGDAPPARAAMEVARLPRDVKVEIMVTAVKTK